MRLSIVITSLALPLLLTACGGNDDEAPANGDPQSAGANDKSAMEKAEKQATMDAAADGKIDCALNGAETFSRNCDIERISVEDGELLVVRHPDGGFRRFRVLTNGRGLELAEGFDDTKINIVESDIIEVESGGNVYRLPAQVKSAPKEAETEPAQEAAQEPADKSG